MDEVGTEQASKLTIRAMIPRFLKALIKTVVIYLFFAIFSAFMIPFEGFYDYQALFTVLFALYLVLVFLTELTKGTVFQHIFGITNSLMIVLYFSYVFNTGVINYTIEQVSLMIDLRFFLALFVIGGLIGFAKSMLQLLNWMNEKEEQWLQYQLRSL